MNRNFIPILTLPVFVVSYDKYSRQMPRRMKYRYAFTINHKFFILT